MSDKYIMDENGRWIVDGIAKLLIEPSQKYLDEHQPVAPPTQPPSIEERLSAVEAAILQIAGI